MPRGGPVQQMPVGCMTAATPLLRAHLLRRCKARWRRPLSGGGSRALLMQPQPVAVAAAPAPRQRQA